MYDKMIGLVLKLATAAALAATPAPPPAPATAPATAPAPEQSTSAIDAMAGGLAGGFLGGIVYRSFGPALGMDAEADGYGKGAVGILDLLALSLLGYAALRWWLERRKR